MNNLEIWNSHATPPPYAIKKITGGNLAGFSDINPVWRIEALTDIFGPVGIGWTTKNVKYWTNEINNEILCFCSLELIYFLDGKWSEPVHGIGGSELAVMVNKKDYNSGKYSKVLKLNDEAYKMAETDALSVACKKIGIANQIYFTHPTKYTKNNFAEIPEDTKEAIKKKSEQAEKKEQVNISQKTREEYIKPLPEPVKKEARKIQPEESITQQQEQKKEDNKEQIEKKSPPDQEAKQEIKVNNPFEMNTIESYAFFDIMRTIGPEKTGKALNKICATIKEDALKATEGAWNWKGSEYSRKRLHAFRNENKILDSVYRMALAKHGIGSSTECKSLGMVDAIIKDLEEIVRKDHA